VEWETEHALAHALIQRQDGTERIALGQISTQRVAIFTNVKEDASSYLEAFYSPKIDSSLF